MRLESQCCAGKWSTDCAAGICSVDCVELHLARRVDSSEDSPDDLTVRPRSDGVRNSRVEDSDMTSN